MPDGAPQTGQRVWRWCGEFYTFRNRGERGIPKSAEPGIWHPLDPKALAETRETCIEAMWNVAGLNRTSGIHAADAVMQAIGLTPPEPKEGGA